jgi:hypothetical protein
MNPTVETKTMFLNGVTGAKIVEEQDLINHSKKMSVIATVIQPRMQLIETSLGPMTKDGNQIYDAWIYYEVDSLETPAQKQEAPPMLMDIEM